MTLKARVIPCLDVKDGRVVKGINFVDLVDAGDPVEAAKAYDAAGADELCFLDITASSDRRETIYDVVAHTAEQCFMPLTVGGGVRAVADIRRLLLAGADKVSINTAAVADPDLVARAADKFGNQCIVVAIDAKEAEPGRWEIFTHGGRTPTGIDAVEFAVRVAELGAGEILLTSMGPGRDKVGIRSCADPQHSRRGFHSGDRLGRRRHARSPGRRHSRRPCHSRVGRIDLPLRHPYDRRSESTYAAGRSGHAHGWNRLIREGQEPMDGFSFEQLEQIVTERGRSGDPDSWTARLFAGGIEKAAQKLGEESVETVIAAVGGDRDALICESADLVYHWLVVLALSGVPLSAVLAELERRTGQSGLAEKAGRPRSGSG